MNVEKVAYVQSCKDGMPANELLFAAYQGFLHLGYDVRLFTREDMVMGRIDVKPETPVAGGVPVVQSAMRKVGATVPSPLDYPKPLQSLLGRTVRQTTMRQAISMAKYAEAEPFFLKPAAAAKLFTGLVVRSLDDIAGLHFVDLHTLVLVSDVLPPIVSEFRTFVKHTQILHSCCYDGSPFHPPDERIIKQAVHWFTIHSDLSLPCAYALDFARLEDGRTVFIEANDAYSLGCYTLATSDYAEMLQYRWWQICGFDWAAEMFTTPPPP